MIPTIDVFADWRAEVDPQARNVKLQEEDSSTPCALDTSRIIAKPRYYEEMTMAKLAMETSCTSLDSFFSYADEEITLAPTYISFDSCSDLESLASNDAASTDGHQAALAVKTAPGRRPMPDWMTVRGDGNPMTKTVGDKVYSWCDHHCHWCEHTTEECRAKNRSTTGVYFSKSYRGCRGGKSRTNRKNRMYNSCRSLGCSMRK